MLGGRYNLGDLVSRVVTDPTSQVLVRKRKEHVAEKSFLGEEAAGAAPPGAGTARVLSNRELQEGSDGHKWGVSVQWAAWGRGWGGHLEESPWQETC